MTPPDTFFTHVFTVDALKREAQARGWDAIEQGAPVLARFLECRRHGVFPAQDALEIRLERDTLAITRVSRAAGSQQGSCKEPLNVGQAFAVLSGRIP